MGWLSKILYKDTDLIDTIWALGPHMKAMGFTTQQLDEVFEGDKLIMRLKVQRRKLKLTAVWDGEVLTFLQMRNLTEHLNFDSYQSFHSRKKYFVLTYGLPEHTLIVKHSLFMSKETPVLAASIERVMQAWTEIDVLGLPGVSSI